MTMLADTADAVIGVDTHTDTHTACMLDRLGGQIATVTMTADPKGCRMLLAWAVSHAPGPRLAWAVEGTARTAWDGHECCRPAAMWW